MLLSTKIHFQELSTLTKSLNLVLTIRILFGLSLTIISQNWNYQFIFYRIIVFVTSTAPFCHPNQKPSIIKTYTDPPTHSFLDWKNGVLVVRVGANSFRPCYMLNNHHHHHHQSPLLCPPTGAAPAAVNLNNHYLACPEWRRYCQRQANLKSHSLFNPIQSIHPGFDATRLLRCPSQ